MSYKVKNNFPSHLVILQVFAGIFENRQRPQMSTALVDVLVDIAVDTQTRASKAFERFVHNVHGFWRGIHMQAHARTRVCVRVRARACA
jgi:hypothetical protein